MLNPFLPSGYPGRTKRELDRVGQEMQARQAWLDRQNRHGGKTSTNPSGSKK